MSDLMLNLLEYHNHPLFHFTYIYSKELLPREKELKNL